MWNWKKNQWIAACAVGLMASMPAQALIISKSNTNQVVVGSSGAETINQSVDFLSADFSGAADDLVQNLTVDIDFIKCGGSLSIPLSSGCSDQQSADNASVSQIGFSLTDPLGTIVNLVFPETSTTFGSYSDTSPGGRIQVRFDDSATQLVGFSNPSYMSGTFYPEGFLSDFIGNHAIGSWNLAITNSGAGAPLGVARFTVNVEVKEGPAPVSEPDTMALLILGLVGLITFKTGPSLFPITDFHIGKNRHS